LLPEVTTTRIHSSGVPESGRPRWYALYTCSRHEKRVAAQLVQNRFECFLPVYQSLRRWKDRRVKVDFPLFPGYLFVNIPWHDRIRVLQVHGVVRLVGMGRPEPIPDEQIQALRDGIDQRLKVEPYPFLRIGRRVRVKRGPLLGAEGFLVRKRDNFRLVLSLELIGRSVALEIDATDIEPVNSMPARRSESAS